MYRARIARPSDHETIARLCRRAVGPGDYVLWVLKQAIAARGLFLAFHDDELVGMLNFERCIDGSGWLGMARTDPRWRRKGVALFLQQESARHALRQGINVLRFWVLHGNKPALKAAVKGGFRTVCEASHISCNVRRLRDGLRPERLRMAPAVLREILASKYLAKMSGYLGYSWHFVKADKDLFQILRKRGELYSMDGSKFILSRPRKFGNVDYSSFTLLDGPAASSLRALRRAVRSMSPGEVGSFLPYDRYLVQAAVASGFHWDEWGRRCVVFEKKL